MLQSFRTYLDLCVGGSLPFFPFFPLVGHFFHSTLNKNLIQTQPRRAQIIRMQCLSCAILRDQMEGMAKNGLIVSCRLVRWVEPCILRIFCSFFTSLCMALSTLLKNKKSGDRFCSTLFEIISSRRKKFS